MAETINYRFVMRRALADTWATLNDVLLEGEYGFEKDTGKVKIGDGSTPWNDLDYFESGGAAGVRVESGTSYLITAEDEEKTIICSNVAAFSLVLPANSTEALPLGFRCAYVQGSGGVVSVSGEVGVTVRTPNGASTGKPYDGGVAEKIGANEWQLWNSPPLANVASSGNYNDLVGKPDTLLQTVNEQTGTAYTLGSSDSSALVRCTNAAAVNVTIPASTTASMSLLCPIPVMQGGTGLVTIVADTGVTLEAPNGATTTGPGDFRVLLQRDVDVWVVA